MPFVEVTFPEVPAEDVLEKFVEAVTQGVQSAAGSPRESVRVLVHEVPEQRWFVGGQRISDT